MTVHIINDHKIETGKKLIKHAKSYKIIGTKKKEKKRSRQ
jgi:hypothetical protein